MNYNLLYLEILPKPKKGPPVINEKYFTKCKCFSELKPKKLTVHASKDKFMDFYSLINC